MRKYIVVAAAVFLAVGTLSAAELGSDDFSYPDGSLTDNPPWVSHSGTLGDLLVASGQAVVQHGTPSEDASYPIAAPATGDVFFAFDFSVDDAGTPIPGTDNEYFAHFKDAGTGYRARMDIVPPTGAGDFSVGISGTSTAEVTWATDLDYATVYRVVVRYDIDNDQQELWIDAAADTDTSIIGTANGSPLTVAAFALRQSDSDLNETIRVDNLMIGTLFTDVVTYVPVELQSFSIE